MNYNLIKKTRLVFSSRTLAYALAAISMIAGIATVFTMTGPFAQNYNIETVVNLVYLENYAETCTYSR